MPVKYYKKIKKRGPGPRRRARKMRRAMLTLRNNRIGFSNNKYHFKRRFDGTGSGTISSTNTSFAMPKDVTVSGGITVNLGMEFQFAYLSNYTEFTSLFDQFRINKIVMELRCRYNPESATSITEGVYPEIFYCRDHDDATNISTSVMRQYSNCKRKILKPGSITRISIKPSVLAPIYRALANNYAPKWKQWIDCSLADTPHFGLKVNIANNSPTATYIIECDYVYYFSVRTVR